MKLADRSSCFWTNSGLNSIFTACRPFQRALTRFWLIIRPAMWLNIYYKAEEEQRLFIRLSSHLRRWYLLTLSCFWLFPGSRMNYPARKKVYFLLFSFTIQCFPVDDGNGTIDVRFLACRLENVTMCTMFVFSWYFIANFRSTTKQEGYEKITTKHYGCDDDRQCVNLVSHSQIYRVFFVVFREYARKNVICLLYEW